MFKNPSQTAISLVSLASGLTFFFLICIWVKDELSYDTAFKDPKQIARIETTLTLKDGTRFSLPSVGWPVGKALISEYPEIESLTYMRSWAPIISFKGTKFYESAFYADKDFFHVFGYALEEGNPSSALAEPHSMVITEKLKEKYFGKEGSAIGKILMLNDTVPYKITGVLKDQGATPSHLQFDMLGSFSSLLASDPKGFQDEFSSGWFDVNVFNYIRIKKPASAASLNTKAKDLILRDGAAAVASTGMRSTLLIRPVSDIYLYSGLSTGATPTGDIKMVRLFMIIGIIILIIACLNFINLTTARSIERAKDIGIRKVLGSRRSGLILQFMMESAWLCILAGISAFIIMLFLLPVLNTFTGKSFHVSNLFSISNALLFLTIIIIVIPLSGLYPAWVLSSFKPVKVLKGRFSHTNSGNFLRKALVVTQFTISLGFILSTIVIWKQMKFMQDQALGFDVDKVLLVTTNKIPWRLANKNADVYKTALLNLPGVKSVSACGAVPGRTGWDGQFAYPEGRTKEQGSVVEYIPVDADYIKTLGLDLAAGRDFIPESKVDKENNLVVNESAVKAFGWGNASKAIGKKLSTSGKDGIVIGVLKDYHQHSLREAIRPVVLGIGQSVSLFAISYGGQNPKRVTNLAKRAWDNTFSGYSFEYRFMNEDFQQQYKKDANFESLFGLAACLSVAIACIGLLGLSIYSTQTRLKEIGVRKVLGASVINITGMLSRETILLVMLSILIASPVAWIGMNNWLLEFAYRTHLDWWIFPLAAVIAIGIALVTIAFTTIRAAVANPVKTLRAE